MVVVPLDVIVQGSALFTHLRTESASTIVIVLKDLLPLALIPPILLFIGSRFSGWQIGAQEAIYLDIETLVLVSASYFACLAIGFIGFLILMRWMAPTYDASRDINRHLTLVATVGTPMVIGSIAHLYPHVFINMVAIIPALMWSMYLLYRGVPKLLDTTPQQGMLMASVLVGVVLVAAVTLLCVSVVLWTLGYGPTLGL